MARRQNVLIVEDSPTQAFRLRSLLESGEFDATVAPSAEEGLEQIKKNRPDVILLDYHLPGMNGEAFCRQIKENVSTRAIPVLMLTVEQGDAFQTRGLESGADDYLQKSADPAVLLMRVRNLARGAQSGEPIVDLNVRASRARVLAVDNSPTYRQFLRQELRSERYQLELAASGEEGLHLLQNGHFDCVLIDFEISDMDAIEFCRRITRSSREQGSDLAIVMLASRGDEERQLRALEAGADDYINKSSDIEVVKSRIRAILRRKFLVDENRRILDEFRERELEAERARAEQAAAELRATLADQLAAANRELESANRRLAEALEVTRAITENAAEALLVVNATKQVTFVNPAAETLFGFSSADLLGSSLDGKLIPLAPGGSELSGADHPLEQCLRQGVTVKGADAVFITSNGSRIEMACSYSPVLEKGAVKAAVLVLHDLSERKRAEERLRQTQKLESIGLLASGIAHDFNNLLVGVIGNASLVADMLSPTDPSAEMVQSIIKTGEQLAHLTRQMLAYSGKGRFFVEVLDVSAVVRDIADLVRPSIPKKVILHYDLSEDLPPIEADRGQVQQVLMNLVINAAEAIGADDGLVTVATRAQVVDAEFLGRRAEASDLQPGLYVALEVRDTGSGMDETVKAKIFDPFFSTKFTGRGLGLAAVHGIVRGHKGAILLRTAPGQGSSFTVLFPVTERRLEKFRASAAKVAAQASGVVLIVDDESVVRSMAKGALERRGYTVLVAYDGLAAIDICKRRPGGIDLAVLDLSMPGISGEETLPELRKIRPNLKVLVSSGYSEAEAMTLFKGQRVSGFVQKPYTPTILIEKIRRALE